MRSATIRRKSASRVSVRSGQRNVMDQPHYANPTHPSLTIEPEQDPSRQPTIRLSARRGIWKRIGWPVGRAGAGIAATMLLCALLTALGLGATLNGGMVTLGFDPERAQFLQFVLMTLIGSLAAGFVLRSRLAAWLGGLLYFVAGFLVPYIAQAQHPALSADGARQLLVPGAFVINVATLLSLAIVAAGAGAVLGQACGEVAVKPFVILGRSIRGRMSSNASKRSPGARSLLAAVPALCLTLVLAMSLVFIADNVGTILNYGTTAAIYQPVQAAQLRGVIRSDAYRSPTLGGSTRQFLIYLPPSYGISRTQRYPVIYLLHGVPGSMSNWFGGANADATANDLFASGKARETIFVSPDGNGSLYKVSEWANSLNGRQNMEDALVDDLVPYIDAHYRTIADPANRTLAGISDGGYGAANIALHHPDVFGKVLSLGGFFMADKSAVFGTGPLNDAFHRFNSPAVYVTTPDGLTAARSIIFLIGAATQDRGYYGKDLAFYRQLQRLGVHTELISVIGSHSWQTWGSQFAKALPLLEPPLVKAHQPNSRSL